MIARGRLVLVSVGLLGCTGNYHGSEGLDATIGDGQASPDGNAIDEGGADSAGGSDPFRCPADSGCALGSYQYCFATGVMNTNPQPYCCSGSGVCGQLMSHSDGQTTFYDCMMPKSCTKAEALCFCELEAQGCGGTMMDDPGCPGQACCAICGSAWTCWGYDGVGKCKRSSTSMQQSQCPASTPWQ